jgi:hypothetical protein
MYIHSYINYYVHIYVHQSYGSRRAFPVSTSQIKWIQVLDGSSDKDIYREMRRKQKPLHMNVRLWIDCPTSRAILFSWMSEVR